MKFVICSILAVFTIALFSTEDIFGDILFQESIDQKATYRYTIDQDNPGEPIFEETTHGNMIFGVLIKEVEYSHSLNDIKPPLFPDAQIKSASLTLDIRLRGGETFSVTIDDFDLGHYSYHTEIMNKDDGDDDNDFPIEIEIGPLIDGTIWIEVEWEDGEHEDEDDQIYMGLSKDDDDDCNKWLKLDRSLLEVTYKPASPTSTENRNQYLPTSYWLADNFPNPFNPTTTIKYNIPKRAWVKVDIINALGEKVRVLENNHRLAGTHTLVWDGKSDNGTQVPTGVYLYRIQAGDFQSSKKMIMIK